MSQAPATTRKLIKVDKLASSTVRLNLRHELEIEDPKKPEIGDVVVVRTLTDNSNYNLLELTSGRMARIKVGDILVGVLGRRRALKGFVGHMPSSINTGDKLHLLNLGGLIGKCTGQFQGLGKPIQVEFLGSVVQGERVLNIKQNALVSPDRLESLPPLLIVAGTAMNSGKTQVVTELIKQFTRNGYRVAGAKLTGVAALRDLLNMEDHGAIRTLSFLDCGYPSTVGVSDPSPIARTILHHLHTDKPDLVAIELGDGLLGDYHVSHVFDDELLYSHCAALVLCASNFVGTLGGIHILQQKYRKVDVVSGPTTDSKMGVRFVQKEFGIEAANAINDGERLFALVEERLKSWQKQHQS